jgi:hypothetical protein
MDIVLGQYYGQKPNRAAALVDTAMLSTVPAGPLQVHMLDRTLVQEGLAVAGCL